VLLARELGIGHRELIERILNATLLRLAAQNLPVTV
jgi:hypothetical protein